MTDKVETKVTDSVTSKTEVEEVNGVELRAKESGWVPKEEYKGEKRWVDAEEFLDRQELYTGLHKANRTIKKLEKTVSTMAQHTEEVKQAAYDKAIKDLQTAKKQAARENDVEKVVELEEKLDEVKEQQKKAAKSEVTKEDVAEIFEEWKSDNKWFTEDEDLNHYASGFGSKIQAEHPEWDTLTVLKEIEKKVKKAFPTKFKNPNRETPSKVANSNGSEATKASKNKMPTYNELPKEAQEMYKVLVKSKNNPHGALTSEQYIKDYALKAGIITEE